MDLVTEATMQVEELNSGRWVCTKTDKVETL